MGRRGRRGGGEGEERIVGRRGGGEERRGWGVIFIAVKRYCKFTHLQYKCFTLNFKYTSIHTYIHVY